MKISIADKTYTVELAETDKERALGLSKRSELKEDEGMLFIFPEEDIVSMWMKNCNLHLDIIFMDESGEVLKVVEGQPNSEKLLICKDCKYVLEVNCNSGIKKGDEAELEDIDDIDEEDEEYKMIVLDDQGDEQYRLKGNERIFSRPNTKVLVRQAKTAFKTKEDKDYATLGRLVFKFIEKQDKNEKEFVTIEAN